MPNFRSLPSVVALTALLFQACDLADSTRPFPEAVDSPKTASDSATQAGKIIPPPGTDSTHSDTGIVSVPKDTAGTVPADSATQVPADTLKPVPVDTLKPVPVDTLKPVPVDTLKPVPVDTLKPVPVDTLKPVPVDTLKPVPVDTLKPVPVDTLKPVPVDTLKPVPVDTLKPVPVDTLKPVPVDTLKPVPVDTLKPVPADTLKPVPVDTLKPVPVDTLKPVLPPLGPVLLRSDLEDQTAACWSNREANGYSRARCGTWSQIGSWGAKLAEGRAHSGSKALSVTFSANEEVAGASLPVLADKVNVRAYYMFDAGFDFGQGVKVGRISSFNEATQMNDIDIILAVRSSGSVNQCGLTDMADISLLFNGRPVGYDWGSINGAVRFVRDRWYAVEYQVKLNRPGARDGSVKLWVDGKLVASKEGINIRGQGGESVKLNRLRMGGWYSNGANGNSCRNPSQPSTLFIDDVAVGSDYIGP